MKLFKKIRKGFTLIELVVVIAVIAILAAVSVVSYVAITNKAKESNDHMVIDQVNTALTGSSILSKKATVHEIVDSLVKEEGFDVRQIKPELKNTKFVYLYEENTFGYWKDSKVVYPKSVEGKGSESGNDIWFFEDTAAASYTDEYSHYLKSAGSVTAISTNGGLDLGECSGIKSISLARETKAKKDLIIRTNGEGTSLTVNAPLDTVHHYDYLEGLTVKAVDPNHSYHEHGTIRVNASIESGHFVVEKDGYVNELLVPEVATSVSVNVKPQGTVNTAVLDNTSATVVIDSGATVEQVIAEDASNISGSGSASAKEGVVEKTLVTTKKELLDAVADETNVKYILLGNNIDVEDRLTLDRDIIIDGSSNKYSLSFSKENVKNGRAINVGFDVPNKSVTLKNLKVVGPTSGGFTRGLNVGQENTKLIVDNCEVSCKYYALNVITSADNASITISNSKLSGWASLNLWASIKIDVNNSELISTSISQNEGFANICFEADTTRKTSDHVSDAKVTVRNSIIKTIYGYESGDGYNSLVGYNYTKDANADHNEFEAINCDLQWEGSNDNLILAYDYCNYGSVTSNVTKINGKTLDFGTNWYYEK